MARMEPAPHGPAPVFSYTKIAGCFDLLTRELTREVLVCDQLMDELRSMNVWRYNNAQTARSVLRAPSAVYVAVRKTQFMEPWGQCYVGQPEFMRNAANDQVALPNGQAFVAYISPGGHLFEWGLEHTEPNDPTAPRGAAQRYGDLQWHKNY